MENDKLHILVVDDDDRIRGLIKDYLLENNYIVSSAENAEDAKIKISYFNFDVIILDVMMPGQDGYELTKEIKKKSDVPIILLTAKGEVENRIKGLELGANDYIGKPFEPKELLLRIKNILKNKNKVNLNSNYKVGDALINLKKMTISLKKIDSIGTRVICGNRRLRSSTGRASSSCRRNSTQLAPCLRQLADSMAPPRVLRSN